jgi:hypothetical protein
MSEDVQALTRAAAALVDQIFASRSEELLVAARALKVRAGDIALPGVKRVQYNKVARLLVQAGKV